jgi:hypothetical protein
MHLIDSRAPDGGIFIFRHADYDKDGYKLDTRHGLLAAEVCGRMTKDRDAMGHYIYDPETVGDIVNPHRWHRKDKSSPPSGWSFAWPSVVIDDSKFIVNTLDKAMARWKDPEASAGGPNPNGGADNSAGGDVNTAVMKPDAQPPAKRKRRQETLLPIKDDPNIADDQFDKLTPSNVSDDDKVWPAFPVGYQGLMVAATNAEKQVNSFRPTDPRLIAPNYNGDYTCGSLVCDLDTKSQIDPLRTAKLQSAFRVVKFAKGKSQGVATPDVSGSKMPSFVETPDFASRGGAGGPKAPSKEIAFGENAIAWNITLTGRSDTIGGLVFERKKDGTAIIGMVDAEYTGPFVCGGKSDIHRVSRDADGNPVNSLHIDTRALFMWSGATDKYDGPLKFEKEEYPSDVSGGTKKIPVHLVWNVAEEHEHVTGKKTGKWQWYADAVLSPEQKPCKDPVQPGNMRTYTGDGRTIYTPDSAGGGYVPTPDSGLSDFGTLPGGSLNTPPMVSTPDTAVGTGASGGGGYVTEGEIDRSGSLGSFGNPNAYSDPLPKTRETEIGGDGRLTGSSSMELNMPSMSFRGQSPEKGQYDITQDISPSASAMSNYQDTVPTVCRAEAFTKQGKQGDGTCGTGPGTGKSPEYTHPPCSGIYGGGTADGGCVFGPPELRTTDMVCSYADTNPDRPIMKSGLKVSMSTVIFAPGVSHGFGEPCLWTGSINTGYTSRVKSGALQWYSHDSIGYKSEAVVFTTGQDIGWRSGTDYYGYLRHDNTLARNYDFPDFSDYVTLNEFQVGGFTNYGKCPTYNIPFGRASGGLSNDPGFLFYDDDTGDGFWPRFECRRDAKFNLWLGLSGPSKQLYCETRGKYEAFCVKGDNDQVHVDGQFALKPGGWFIFDAGDAEINDLNIDAYGNYSVYGMGSNREEPPPAPPPVVHTELTGIDASKSETGRIMIIFGVGPYQVNFMDSDPRSTYQFDNGGLDFALMPGGCVVLCWAGVWKVIGNYPAVSAGSGSSTMINIGTTGLAVASGDLSAGANGGNQLFWDASDGRMNWQTDDTTVVHYVDVDDGCIFNVDNDDMDFVVRGVTDDDLVHVDASTDMVGIGVAAPSSKLDVAGDIEIGDSNYHYYGDPSTNGSWRVCRSGANLIYQRLITGTWTTKLTIPG